MKPGDVYYYTKSSYIMTVEIVMCNNVYVSYQERGDSIRTEKITKFLDFFSTVPTKKQLATEIKSVKQNIKENLRVIAIYQDSLNECNLNLIKYKNMLGGCDDSITDD